jgi:hypothetical protein
MLGNLVPVKTEDGHAELARRLRGLSQRHRTVLLLVDGRRSVQQVRQMAAAAGVPAEVFDELVALGLVSTALPGENLQKASQPPSEDSLLPSVGALLPESEQGAFDEIPLDPVPDALVDHPLEQAREMLMRALRAEAPVTGSLTILKLRRVRDRAELRALLPEIDQRIRSPRKQLMTAQLMRQVKHLLTLPAGEP